MLTNEKNLDKKIAILEANLLMWMSMCRAARAEIIKCLERQYYDPQGSGLVDLIHRLAMEQPTVYSDMLTHEELEELNKLNSEKGNGCV